MTVLTEAATAAAIATATAEGSAGAVTAAASDPTTRPVQRMVWRLATAPAQEPARSLAGRRITVVGGDAATAGKVREALRLQGATVAPAGRPAAGTAGPAPDTVVDLTLAERFVPGVPGQWREALLRTFGMLRDCYEEWSRETAADRLTYLAVTYHGGGMGYHPADDLAQPLGGLWAGLAKTLHRELPNCRARVLDTALADLDALPGRIVSELVRPGLSEIGHRDGKRWTLAPDRVPPGRPALRWTAADTVLVSGGGRGIGMAFARQLCSEFGLRAVVTGRAELPPEDTWDGYTAEALAERRGALWATHREGRAVSRIRQDIARAESTWELVANLRSARAEGLRLDYRPCDFTDGEQVRALVAGLPGLTAVVHNAGVDRPTRLPNKTDEDIAAVVSTKVDAFVHLVAAVRGLDLKVLCTVGSLTGRLGGMVGQFDYAAANECLARLGMWAERQVSFPVMTLAWPTWARLGLIANFEASLRYMTAMDVTEGLAHWRAELLAGSRGEVSFVGPLGRALDPVQALGYPMTPSLPGYAETYPKVFHVGRPEVFEAHERLCSVVEFDPSTSPAVGDFTVQGAPALPVGLLLESAVRGAEWVVPQDLPEQTLHAVEDVRVPWPLLRCPADGPLRLRRDVRAAGLVDGRWTVQVTFRPVDATDAADAPATAPDTDGDTARMRLVFAEAPAPGAADAADSAAVAADADLPPAAPLPAARTGSRSGAAVTTVFTDAPVLGWRGLVVPLGTWRPAGRHGITVEVGRCHPHDLWAVPQPPTCTLPVAAVENLVRAVTERTPGLYSTPDPLVVQQLTLHGAAPERVRLTGDPALGVWRLDDAATGRTVARVRGLAAHRI
ncbi:KR domain-containing protein [Streptomyces xanthophaeus]|uniref:KR domain-containing protein n=1 Tax=Streptomyces xanthophaeus TaxID=67385 RepID=UPI0006911BFB|nr:KR domain-containing protein [Streptomyces xanthophaeus]